MRPGAIHAGWGLSLIVVLVLLADGMVELFAPGNLQGPMQETGWQAAQLPLIGVVTLVSAILYAIPRTAVLGAILIAGFAGGAIATHARLGEIGSPPQIICALIGVAAWGGLYLRDPRVRALLPIAD